MWIEKTGKKFRACTTFKDPLTGKRHKIGVTIDRNTPQARNNAKTKLDEMVKMKETATPDCMPLSDLVKLYRAAQKPILKKSTYMRNYYKCNTFISIFGEKTDVNKMTAGIVKAGFIKHKPAPGAVNENIIRFKALLRWAYQNDFIKDSAIIDKLTPMKDAAKKEKLKDKYLEPDECNKLLDAMKMPVWHNLTQFLILSGCRIGEVFALNENDVDLINREITINKTYDHNNRIITDPKTYASNRMVYMQDELYALTRSILAQNQKNRKMLYLNQTPLFFDLTGAHAHYDAYRKYLRETSLKVLGRKITPHIFRHTHASLLAENGLPFDVISRRLGHEDSKITRDIYIHITEKRKEKDNEMIKQLKLI